MTRALRRKTFKTLWRRSPSWRLSTMSAMLFTLLFILFPPITQINESTQNLVTEATYTHQSLPVIAKLQPPSNQAIVQTSPPPVQLKATTQPAQKNPVPQTANISLAVAGNTQVKPNGTGLDTALTGQLYSGSIRLSGYQIPLPRGEWAMLAATRGKEGDTITITNYFLAQIKNKRLAASLIVHALENPNGSEIPTSVMKSDACANYGSSELYGYNGQNELSPPQQGCWLIQNHLTIGWLRWADRGFKMSNLERAAAGDMAAKGVTYGQDLIEVEYTMLDKSAVLNVIYSFSPEADGISSNNAATFLDADWAPNNIKRYPEKLAYIEKLKQWGTTTWPSIKAAFNSGKLH